MKKTQAITFKKTLKMLDNKEMPIETEGIIYKEQEKLKIKVIGTYNPGFVQRLFNVKDHIL